MAEAARPTRAHWLPVFVIYAASVLMGLAIVSFPALGEILTAVQGLTDTQYGAIFLPQVAMAAGAAVAGGALARRIGLKTLLLLSLAVTIVCQLLLASSALVAMPAESLIVIMAGTAALGLGLGLFAAPLNSLPPLLFPNRKEAAVVAAHTLFGVGLAGGPLIAAVYIDIGIWFGFPLLLAGLVVMLGLVALATAMPEEAPAPATAQPERGPIMSLVFWLFAGISMLYAFAEGTFSNWAVIYLREGKGLDADIAAAALSVFWAALVAGRLAMTAALVHFSATPFWVGLPVLMAAAFLLLPYADSTVAGIGLFAFAGLACSAFFPLTITLVSQRFPQHVAFVSSLMIAALMTGIGVGTFALGALREQFEFEALYRLSALYPAGALILALAVLVLSRRRHHSSA